MSRRMEGPLAAPSEPGGAAHAPGRGRRRVAMLIVAVVLALLVGALGGSVLYLLLEGL